MMAVCIAYRGPSTSGLFSDSIRTGGGLLVSMGVMTRLTTFAPCLIAMSSALLVSEPAGAEQHIEKSAPIARGAVRIAAEFAFRQPAVDEAWSRAIAQLIAGTEVRADLDQGALRGIFVDADDQSMTLETNGSPGRVVREQIRRVAMAAGTHQKRHESVGLGVGAILGTAIMARRCQGQSISSACWEEAMAYLGGPMFVGGFIGHKSPKGVAWREIYVRRTVQ